MLATGQTLSLTIEKPAAGGRMIARADGQVVLVAGAIPGERVEVAIERVTKSVAHGRTVRVEVPSADRRVPGFDPRCGGSLYAFIDYRRQLLLKADVISDALLRIGRLPWTEPVVVRPSPTDGYRMRARLHWRQQRLGFFNEGSHGVCEARLTRQLGDGAFDALDEVGRSLRQGGLETDAEVELSENVDATERAVHVDSMGRLAPGALAGLNERAALTGLTIAIGNTLRSSVQALAGEPYVIDRFTVGDRMLRLRRHVLSFFQGNRFLLQPLVEHVAGMIAPGRRVVDLYAGVGLFSVAAAARGAVVTAVEGDPLSSQDLAVNGAPFAIETIHEPVEHFVRRACAVDVVVVDPPRTGISKEAIDGVIRLRASEIIYVSCDVATFARDARRLIDAGYRLTRLDGFDLFPNTPHVETVALFSR